jgi:G:T-mismatch repair DNA endonuclease (very short patch repair protein)
LNKNYKLNTRGELIVIGNRIPDIVNINEKKIIELFGDYWHKNETKEEQDNRMNTYKNNGYSALIVWETELKNEDLLIKKLNNFI